MALFDKNRFRALASAFMLSAVLAGCGNGGGGGLPGTTFRSGNITADSPELTALTADPNTAANRVNIAGNIVDVVDDGDDMTTDTPVLSFAAVIDAGGNPAAPTDDAATADVDESEETDAEVLARLDSLWIVSGGVVNNIVITAPAAGDLHIQNFEVITVDGGMVRGDISNGDTPTTYTVMSGTVGVAAVVEVVGVVDDPATTEVDETVVAVTGVAASGGDITGGAGADIFNLIGGTILGTVSGGAEADTFIVAGNIVDDSDTAMDGEQRALTISAALDGGGGDDTFWLNEGGVVRNIANATGTGDVNLASFEAITINGGTVNGNITNAAAATIYTVMSGTVGTPADPDADPAVTASDGNITGGAMIDTFNIEGGTIVGNVVGGAEADIFNLTGGTIEGNVDGGAGADSFVISAGITIGGMLDGGADADTLSLATGFTPTAANLFGGVLTLTLNGGGSLALTLANIATDNIDVGTLTLTTMMLPAPGDGMTPEPPVVIPPTTLTFSGTAGADIFAITTDLTGSPALPLESVIDGLGGADVLELNAGAVVASIAFANTPPTEGAVNLQNVETITLNGGTVNSSSTVNSTISARSALAAITFNIMSGNITGTISPGGSNSIHGSNGNDIFNISGGTIADRVNGGDGNDTFNLTGGTINGNVFGSDGADLFIIAGDATGSALNINDRIVGGAGDDELRLNTGAVVASIAFINTASIGRAVHLFGIETITLNGGTVNGNITGPAAATTFNLTSGTVGGNVVGGAGVDAFVIGSGITITGFIDGGTGTDTFTANMAVNVRVTTAADTTANTIRLRNVETITLSNQDDTLILLEGSVGRIILGGGNDELTVTGGVTFDLTINGGTSTGDMDRFVWGDGLTTSGVTRLGGPEFMLAGRDPGTDDTHDGTNTVTDPTSFEVFVIDGGTIGSYTGFAFVDTLELLSGTVTDAGAFTGVINMGDGDDQLTVTGGVTFTNASIDGGAGTGDRFVWGAGLTTTGVNLGTTAGAFTFAGTNHDGTNTVPNPTGFEVFVLDGGTIGTYTGDNNANMLELLSGMITAIISGGGNDTITLSGGTVTGNVDGGEDNDTFTLSSGTVTGNVNGGAGDDLIIFSGNTRGTNPALDISAAVVLDGQGGTADEVRLVAGGSVQTISFNATGTARSDTVSLQNIEIVTFDGGNVTGGSALLENDDSGLTINMNSGTITGGLSGSNSNDIINLRGGTINANVLGNGGADTINLYSTIRIGGFLSGDGFGGGVGGGDVLRYMGAPAAPDFTFAARSGLGQDDDIRNGAGEVQGFESQAADPAITSLGAGGAGLRGLTVLGFEVLELAPALNLYGALSDALMQFGAQTAQGFALADLNLATGRATSLVSKNSPFTKGRIWAHKITHSGNGKGSIGLGLTGLTARADSDYDYEMSLTQHGFDAPLATTRLGAFNLRAVSHTMTGVIETNIAEAQVSGYGAGLALLWRGGGAAASKASASATRVSAHHSASAHHHHHGLSAHITSLAGAYEVEAHTSPLNPRAVVSEVSEGSFSAINAVVSAGIADTRKIGHSLVLRTTADLVWQTLSLDDFTETGQDGIIINFDKATRFTARVGAGLESEHWFSDVAFVHETSSGGTLSSGLSQDYKQDDGTAIEMKFGGKIADLATGLTLKAYAGLRTSLTRSDALDPSAHLALNWRF